MEANVFQGLASQFVQVSFFYDDQAYDAKLWTFLASEHRLKEPYPFLKSARRILHTPTKQMNAPAWFVNSQKHSMRYMEH